MNSGTMALLHFQSESRFGDLLERKRSAGGFVDCSTAVQQRMTCVIDLPTVFSYYNELGGFW